MHWSQLKATKTVWKTLNKLKNTVKFNKLTPYPQKNKRLKTPRGLFSSQSFLFLSLFKNVKKM